MNRDKEESWERKHEDREAKRQRKSYARRISERRAEKTIRQIRSTSDLDYIEELDDLIED